MSAKGVFATGRLRRIGEHIADANAKRFGSSAPQAPSEPAAPVQASQEPSPIVQEQAPRLPAEASAPAPVQAQAPAPAPAPLSQGVIRGLESEAALMSRFEEYGRLRRDIMAKLGAELAAIPEERKRLQERAAALSETEAKLKELYSAVEAQSELEPGSKEFQQKLAEHFKSVERARLKMIVMQTKLDKTQVVQLPSGGASSRGGESILPELGSLTFKQLFTFGLYLTLPIAGSIIIGGFLVALAILVAMRLGI